MTPLLQTQALELAYGRVPACRDISIDVNAGEIVTLIGGNGAGKSTTLRAIAGALRPRSGTIHFAGADITALPSHERTNLGIALVPEGRRVFPFLTVRENLELGGFKHRKDRARVRRQMEAMFNMFPRLRDRFASTSPRSVLPHSSCATFSRGLHRSMRAAPPCCWSSKTRATRCRSRRAAMCYRPA
jgi:branched-chain amino acid transport system ATP-binding protein